MKYNILVFLILATFLCQGQIGPRQIIADDNDSSYSIFPIDLDQDGDIDLVSAQGVNLVVWYENLGNGEFSQMHIISNNFDWPWAVYCGDIDNDGDIDVVSADFGQGSVVLSRNMDGIGQNWNEEMISTNLGTPVSISLADLDNDGDLDVAAVSKIGDKLVWFENLDGAGNFGEEIIINSNIDIPSYVNHSDLDNDGDIDLLTASWDDRIVWFRNDGQANFTFAQTIAFEPPFGNFQYVGSADLDNDGDFDVITGGNSGDTVAWYENLNGEGDFGEKNVVDNMAFSVRSISSIDIDNDGDKDLLTGGSALFKLVWYENLDGLGSFSDQIFIDQIRAMHTAVADIDNDGDEDIISTSNGLPNNTINWYENEYLLSNSVPSKREPIIFPNPTNKILSVQHDLPIEKASLWTIDGRLVMSWENSITFDLNLIKSGIYHLEIVDIDGNRHIKKIIVE